MCVCADWRGVGLARTCPKVSPSSTTQGTCAHLRRRRADGRCVYTERWAAHCFFFFSFLFYLKLACAGHVAGCIEAKEAKHYARVLEVLYGCQLIPKRTRWHLDCTRAPRQHSGSLRPHTLLLLWSLVVMDRCVKTVFLLSSNGQQWVNGAPVWSN